MKKNVAITGVSGYVGTGLLARLDGDSGVGQIIGIDTREPWYQSPKLVFYRRDVRRPFDDIFAAHKVAAAVHLAFVLRPTRRPALAREIDIQGTRNLVAACRQAGVRHVVQLSSYTVYGVQRDSPAPLTEAALRCPMAGLQYARDKIEAERVLEDFGAAHRDVTVTVLRSAPIMGPGAVGSAATILFELPVMLGVTGGDPPMQFVHEDDLVSLIALLLARRQGGVYNVAGNGAIKYSQVARLVGKRLLNLPAWLLEPAIRLSWALHVQSVSPVGVSYIKYPPVVSTARLAEELGFRFRYSSRQALAAFVRASRSGR